MHHPSNFFMFSPANLQRSHLRVKPSPDMPGVEDSSKRAVPLFKFCMPCHLLIQIVCTHHRSARNCWWTPQLCTRHYLAPCILGNQDPFRMSEGDESDGILGVLLIRTLDDTRRYSWKIAISWWSCLATSTWWWIHHISQIHFARCWRLFQKSRASVQILHALSPFDPDCLHSPPICQELLMDPSTLYKALFGALHFGESRPFQDEWRWRKWRNFGSVAHSKSGWYEVLVENCDLLMKLSRHVKVMMDTSYLTNTLWQVLKTLPKEPALRVAHTAPLPVTQSVAQTAPLPSHNKALRTGRPVTQGVAHTDTRRCAQAPRWHKALRTWPPPWHGPPSRDTRHCAQAPPVTQGVAHTAPPPVTQGVAHTAPLPSHKALRTGPPVTQHTAPLPWHKALRTGPPVTQGKALRAGPPMQWHKALRTRPPPATQGVAHKARRWHKALRTRAPSCDTRRCAHVPPGDASRWVPPMRFEPMTYR